MLFLVFNRICIYIIVVLEGNMESWLAIEIAEMMKTINETMIRIAIVLENMEKRS